MSTEMRIIKTDKYEFLVAIYREINPKTKDTIKIDVHYFAYRETDGAWLSCEYWREAYKHPKYDKMKEMRA